MKMLNQFSMVVRYLALAIMVLSGSVMSANAQEVTPEHLQAARTAMAATGATDRLDKLLPELASFTKTSLIANRPDIESEISAIVDEVAISLAPRRGPLETEVAAIYTSKFTQQELEVIAEFFSSEAGNKFLTQTPLIFREIDQVAAVWRQGVARDMGEQVREKLTAAGLQ